MRRPVLGVSVLRTTVPWLVVRACPVLPPTVLVCPVLPPTVLVCPGLALVVLVRPGLVGLRLVGWMQLTVELLRVSAVRPRLLLGRLLVGWRGLSLVV